MKKLIILSLAFVTLQLSAQDLKSLTSKATSSSSLIEGLAADQVKKLTKSLNLSEAQQSQVSDLVVSQLKSDKMSKLIGSLSPDKLLGSSTTEENNAKITDALNSDPEFQKELKTILDEDQIQKHEASLKNK